MKKGIVKLQGHSAYGAKNKMNKASAATVRIETYVRDRFRLSIDVLLYNAGL